MSEGSGSPIGSGERTKSKTNINSALLSCPTEREFLEKTISVPAKGMLAEGPLVGGLSFAINASIGPVFFLNVLEAPWGQGNTQKRKEVSIQHYYRVQQGTLL